MGDEDKQFEATAHKLQKAREEGQVIKSKDASMAIALVVMFGLIYAMAPFIWEEIEKMFVLIYEQIPNKNLEDIGYMYLALISILPMILILLPIILVAALIAIAGDFFQVGPLVATKAITPKFDKINPVNGFKNIFSSRTVVELVKNIFKVVILTFIGWITFNEFLPKILILGATENVFPMLKVLGEAIMLFVVRAVMFFMLIGGGDYLFQRWKFLKDQKMSFKEIKDEYKQTEGDPHVKAALAQKRMQMLQQRMLEAVPTADVITTNPIHIAIAIKYDREEMEAPRVIAKGTELFAKKIIEIAKNHNIPIIENVPVARALYKLVDINKEVPPELYKAVAEILIFVYNLKEKSKLF